MPMAKQARQIWTEKLRLVHPLPFSGVIFREIGHLLTDTHFLVKSLQKSTNYKTRIDPRDLLYRMHTKKIKKHTPPKAAASNPLDAIIVSHVHKTTRPLPKIPSRQTNATDREQ